MSLASLRTDANRLLHDELPSLRARHQRAVRAFVVVALVVDVALIGVDVIWGLLDSAGVVSDRPHVIQVNQDNSISEYYNFVKWAVAAGLLGTLGRQRRVWSLVSLAMVTLLADDLGQIHERVGKFVEGRPEGDDNGTLLVAVTELAVFGVLAIVVFSLLFLARHRATTATKPLVSRFVVLMLVLAVFGVGVDFIHSLQRSVVDLAPLHVMLYLIEDGGEMIIITLIAAHALRTRLTVTHLSSTSIIKS